MERVFKTRTFARSMKKVRLSDGALLLAVEEMKQGLIDADLGGFVIKKRVPLPGQGKRGSVRTIIATRLAYHWFFLYGFTKNERSSLSQDELKALRELAKELVNFDHQQLQTALLAGEILEIDNGKDNS